MDLTETDYSTVFANSIKRLGSLQAQREDLELAIAKEKRFMRATWELVPEPQRERWSFFWWDFNARVPDRWTLVFAVYRVLRDEKNHYLTAREVRDHLIHAGYDFDHYKSDPLASVSTALRRMKVVDVVERNGVKRYRLKSSDIDADWHNHYGR